MRFCSAITFISGDDVFTPHRQESHDLYVLYSGHLEITAADGQKVDLLLDQGRPVLMGEIAWLTGKGRSVFLTCITEAEALRIDGDALRAWLDENPRAGMAFMRNLAVLLAGRLTDKELIVGAMAPQ